MNNIMKRYIIILTLLSSIISYSQQITRGPEIGEIYFLGPTTILLYDAIYQSTDFGETVECVDSVSALSNTIVAISADKTPGGLYFATMGQALYYSGNYGQYGGWQLQSGSISNKINSGRNEGEIYNRIGSHSIDYGLNFTSHSCQGFFGSTKAAEIDKANDIGYCISYDYEVDDTLYFFISYDNYNNLEVVNKFNFMNGEHVLLSRENNPGCIFLFNANRKSFYLSEDFGTNWSLKNKFTCPNLPIKGITGGRQDGELYLIIEYLQLMGQRRHIYIYHSLDYGETFTIYHPISIGLDPIYANFKAEDTLVEPDDVVQFTDLSNDAETWEWDFDNDGTIDSYEQNPIYFYQDTGYYTVKLSISGAGGIIQDYGIRYNYMHVKQLVSIKEQNSNLEIACHPNPFNDKFTIETKSNFQMIEIYDLNGKSHFTKTLTQKNKTEIIDLRNLEKGIYILKIKTEEQEITKKIIKI